MYQNQLENSPASDEPKRDSLLENIRDTVGANGFGTTDIARVGAILYTSIFDSVNGISSSDRKQSYSQYSVDATDAPRNASQYAAASADSREVLSTLYPGDINIDRLDELLDHISKGKPQKQGLKSDKAVVQEVVLTPKGGASADSVPYQPHADISSFGGSWGLKSKGLPGGNRPRQDSYLEDINQVFLDTMRANGSGTADVARVGAILYTSIFDSVNGISSRDRKQSYSQYSVDASDAPRNASQYAAALAASREVLSSLYPDDTNIDRLDELLDRIPKGRPQRRGLKWGTAVAQEILSERENDGSADSVPYQPNTNIGGFDGSWGSKQFATVTPFSEGFELSDFASDGPPNLDSQNYADSFNEVKQLGSIDSSVRSDDQSEAAKFWQQASGTSRPTGIAFEVTEAYADNTKLSLQDEARLFALVGIANLDSLTVAWDAKAEYEFWRPRDAIRSADADGNGLTTADSEWEAFRGEGNQGGSPEYLSGMGVFAGAWSQVLTEFDQDYTHNHNHLWGGRGYDLFGIDASHYGDGGWHWPPIHNNDSGFGFELSLDTLGTDVMRSYDSFGEAAQEAADSRIWLGTHFGFTAQDSLEIGQEVGTFVYDTQLQSV